MISGTANEAAVRRSAGTLKGLLKIFEGLPNLRLKVIVARKTKTPEPIGSLPDRATFVM